MDCYSRAHNNRVNQGARSEIFEFFQRAARAPSYNGALRCQIPTQVSRDES